MKAICVYCGANPGHDARYAEAARALGRAMVEQNLALVYGGGNVGLMGVIADEVLKYGGEVTGVIPTALVEREVGHTGLTRQFIVKDMHERKAMMASLADGFIAMPGGMGTLEELFEMLTWSQLGIHRKPVGLLNVAGFYDQLAGFISHASAQGFIRPEHVALMQLEAEPEHLLRRLSQAK
ncbi:TIGR00730 family Rossman fold protein [Pseudoduganella danionis]|uniref:Cytokinin riboside 5'-monophosphate phosphoribohydrolase n=1 Tax=Pseudoduganella danionis TaxID=1890295 RepID=A0ABW9SNJ2_9BURK|nr:TIGR00730 family Rossman fold protein [Pseudoduganella danionis]MTW32247.1 TIGR00730 family Rossman fold protein [Pseudoduganella danionis]